MSVMERFAQRMYCEQIPLGFKIEEHLLPIESIGVGFRAKAVRRNNLTTGKTLQRQFRKAIQAFLVHVIQKLSDKCPLKFKTTRAISASSTEIASVGSLSKFTAIPRALLDEFSHC